MSTVAIAVFVPPMSPARTRMCFDATLPSARGAADTCRAPPCRSRNRASHSRGWLRVGGAGDGAAPGIVDSRGQKKPRVGVGPPGGRKEEVEVPLLAGQR